MKKILSFILVLAMLICILPIQTLTVIADDYYGTPDLPCDCSATYAGTYIYEASSLDLTIRSGHGNSYSVVGSIPYGAKVTVSKASGTGNDDWAHITYNDISGYAYIKYLTKLPDINAKTSEWVSYQKMGNKITEAKQGEYVYFCYKTIDENTGKPINEVAPDCEYTATMTFYNPDGTVRHTNQVTNKDSSWIGMKLMVAGTYTYEVVLAGDWSGTFTGSFKVAENPKKIHTSENTLKLTLGGTASKTIKVSDTGYYNGSVTYRWERSNSNVICSWGEWNSDGSCPLTVTARSAGNAKVTVLVKDADSGKTLNSTVVNVTVNAKSYTVKYDANGGAGVPYSQTKYHGTPITLRRTKPTRSGYEFLGWSESSSAASADYKPKGSFNGNANTTLYAVWKKITLTGVSIASAPKKVKYYVGQKFDTTGLVVKLKYSDGSTKVVAADKFAQNGITVSGFSSAKAAEKIYVYVKHGNKSTSFTVKVLPKIVVGWHKEINGWRYQYADGRFAANGWAKIDGERYYFNAKGYRQTGWVKLGEKQYLFNSDGTYSGKFRCADKHKTVKIAAKAATCIKAGNLAHYKCTMCGKKFSGSGKEVTTSAVTLKPKHKNVYVAKVPAKVGKTGVKAHYSCKVCGKRFNGAGKQVTLASLKISALKK